MNTTFRQFVTRALCVLTVATTAAVAHAAPRPVAAFRAKEVVDGKVTRGSQQEIQQTVAPFVDALHVLFTDNEARTAAWVILTPDGKNQLAVCDKLQYDEKTGILYFGGRAIGNSQIVGMVFAEQGRLHVGMRIQSAAVDVVFVQPLERLKIEADNSQG